MSEAPPEDPWLRGLAIVAGVVLLSTSAAGAGQWVAGALALAAALLPWAVVRVVTLGAVAVVGLVMWPPDDAGLPRMGLSTALALVVGGALLARKVEPGLRRPRNAAALASLALLVTLALPSTPEIPTELTAASSWFGVLGASLSTAPFASAVIAITFSAGPFMAAVAWPGPDAGIRRIMPSFILLASALAASWPWLLAASGHAMARVVAGLSFAALALCGEAAIAALLIGGSREGPPPGVILLDPEEELSDSPGAAAR